MLKEFNIGIHQEQVFSREEQTALTQKVDELLREIEKLRKGQEVINDDFIKEVEELKELYFMGKKNWKQIAAGKAVRMIMSGIVSETISQKPIDKTGYTVSSGHISQ